MVGLTDSSLDSSGSAQLFSLDPCDGGAPCTGWQTQTTATAFERTSKRRSGFPSETKVKRGRQIVHGEKELEEKLGRTIYAHAAHPGGFKNCCMQSGKYDGSSRGYSF